MISSPFYLFLKKNADYFPAQLSSYVQMLLTMEKVFSNLAQVFLYDHICSLEFELATSRIHAPFLTQSSNGNEEPYGKQ